jgi:hypothetical protein
MSYLEEEIQNLKIFLTALKDSNQINDIIYTALNNQVNLIKMYYHQEVT